MALAHLLLLSLCKDREQERWVRFLYSRCQGPGRGGNNLDFSNDMPCISSFEEYPGNEDLALRYNWCNQEASWSLGTHSVFFLYKPKSTVRGELVIFWKPPVIQLEFPLCHSSSLLPGGHSHLEKSETPAHVFQVNDTTISRLILSPTITQKSAFARPGFL